MDSLTYEIPIAGSYATVQWLGWFAKTVIIAFIVYQVSSLIAESSLFGPWREKIRSPYFSKLFSCVLCVSVWIAVLGSVVYSPTAKLQWDSVYVPTVFLDSMLYSGLAWFIHLFEMKMSS